MIAVNSLGSQNDGHSRVSYSRSGEQNDLTECMFLSLHHELLIKKQTPPPLFFPVNYLIQSTRCMENLESLMVESGISTDCQVSVRQLTQQSHVSRWYDMCVRSSQSLLSSD